MTDEFRKWVLETDRSARDNVVLAEAAFWLRALFDEIEREALNQYPQTLPDEQYRNYCIGAAFNIVKRRFGIGGDVE